MASLPVTIAAPRRIDVARAAAFAIATLACLAVAMLLVTILWLSFTDGAPGDPQLGYTFAHYREIFFDSFTYRVLGNTLLFLVVTLIVAFALAVPMAWLVERTDFPGRSVVFTLMTVALLIPGFAVALGWLFLLHPRIGLVNQAVMAVFGLERAPFDISTIFGMGVIEGLSLTPITFIMTSVVLR